MLGILSTLAWRSPEAGGCSDDGAQQAAKRLLTAFIARASVQTLTLRLVPPFDFDESGEITSVSSAGFVTLHVRAGEVG